MHPKIFKRFINVLLITTLSCAFVSAQDNFRQELQKIIDNPEKLSDSARLHKLFDAQWNHQMHEYPEWATYVGYPGQNHRWTDNSLAAYERRNNELPSVQNALQSIDRTKLNKQNKLNYDLAQTHLNDDLDGMKFKGEYMAISQLGGVHQDAVQLLKDMPRTNVKEYEDILSRLRGYSTLVDQNVALMEEGLKTGVVPARVTLAEVPQQILNQIKENPAEAPILGAFQEFPATISAAEQERIKKEANQIYSGQIVPALNRLHQFFTQRYLPGCREEIACTALPDGQAWYAYLCKHYTTTNMTPDEIFELGQSEVKRIRGEMDKVIQSTGFNGDFAAFCSFLRTDPQFFFDNPEDLLTEYRNICKKADPELIKLFGILPRLPYGVEPVPSYAEKSQTTAYYNGGSLEAGRPGTFYANTYDLKSRPKWEMEPLSLHEAVPGHHLQIAIAAELEGLPEFRKRGWFTAYGEGWGLYSESLGEEMGFYTNPYSKFGQLSYEMWRAIRLVVDVGMHYKGWNKQQAIDFFTSNVGKAEHDINVEVDRYISWPGQALAYKIGELKIKELRAYSTKELGEKFDIRKFHDQILGNGPLPLDVLEKHMKEWVAEVKKS